MVTTQGMLVDPVEFENIILRTKAFSQEVRLAGAADIVDWLLGVFYSDEDLMDEEGRRWMRAGKRLLVVGDGAPATCELRITGADTEIM